jgi:paraquat-inducible protein A
VTLFEAVRVLWQDGMMPVAALVFGTALLFPLLELVMILLVLVPLRWAGCRRGWRPSSGWCARSSHGAWSRCSCSACWCRWSSCRISPASSSAPRSGPWRRLILALTFAGRAFDTRCCGSSPCRTNRS